MSLTSKKHCCPNCGEVTDRVKRRLSDRVISIFKPVKRYSCHFCDWEGNVPDEDVKKKNSGEKFSTN